MRVLIAEDEPVTRAVLEALLDKCHYDLQIASDGAQAWEMLQRDDVPTLAILDWMMPYVDGPELCKRLRAAARAAYVYIIMLTGKDTKEDFVFGLDAGADDYLSKPYHPEELRARLRAGERILNLESRLRAQASHDQLTGLLNRQGIREFAEREFAHAARGAVMPSVLMADLDHFKCINDTYGHPIGDEVLRQAASRFASALRKYDAVGRYGGEEFMIVLRDPEPGSVMEVADRVRRELSDAPMHTSIADISISVSIGVAQGRPGQTLDDAITEADVALYAAKRNGRNRVATAGAPNSCTHSEHSTVQLPTTLA